MTAGARPYTTRWGVLSQPDKQEPSNVTEFFLKVSSFQLAFIWGKAS